MGFAIFLPPPREAEMQRRFYSIPQLFTLCFHRTVCGKAMALANPYENRARNITRQEEAAGMADPCARWSSCRRLRSLLDNLPMQWYICRMSRRSHADRKV